jgi:hypothetical protein
VKKRGGEERHKVQKRRRFLDSRRTLCKPCDPHLQSLVSGAQQLRWEDPAGRSSWATRDLVALRGPERSDRGWRGCFVEMTLEKRRRAALGFARCVMVLMGLAFSVFPAFLCFGIMTMHGFL